MASNDQDISPELTGGAELPSDNVAQLPFETEELRRKLDEFLSHKWSDCDANPKRTIGSYTWGVYAFYDYDNEPIYVGQTNERLGTRIRRHLTNQRTDAVAMRVLDPYEVCYIEVWPIVDLQSASSKQSTVEAKARLNALEYAAYQKLLMQSKFKAVLNEKVPAVPAVLYELPASFKMKVISDEVSRLRDHPDLRIARRASTLANLAKVIAERKVNKGLRQTLLTQAKRLVDLAARRVNAAPANAEADGDE